jgi:hypothetical protein
MARHEAQPADPQPTPDPPVDRPLGPGWFESTRDLLSGLEVREDLAMDSTWPECYIQPGTGLVSPPAHGALVDLEQLGNLDLSIPAEVPHLDEFSQFGIDGLELL